MGLAHQMDRGAEVLRITATDEIASLNPWLHDGYFEEGIRLSAETGRAFIPIMQEASALPGTEARKPQVVRKTLLAKHWEVPLTRCCLTVNCARSLTETVDWGNPSILEADFSGGTFLVRSGAYVPGVTVEVEGLDIQLFVSGEIGATIYRKVLRGWPIESDRTG